MVEIYPFIQDYTEEEMEEIKKAFLEELEEAKTPKDFHELLIKSSKIDKAFSKTMSGKCGSYENFLEKVNANRMEDAAWERTKNTLTSWNDWESLDELFRFYVSEAVFGGLKNWQTDILNHMETIAETSAQKEYMHRGKEFKKEITRNLTQRILHPTEEQLYEEFIRQSTL